MELKDIIYGYGEAAKKASLKLAMASTKEKNEVLKLMAKKLRENREEIKIENKKDMEAGKENNLSKALLDRLLLDDERIEGMVIGVEKIASLTDPV
jgi:glutamate-5-semialdehyde dehydrogenase